VANDEKRLEICPSIMGGPQVGSGLGFGRGRLAAGPPPLPLIVRMMSQARGMSYARYRRGGTGLEMLFQASRAVTASSEMSRFISVSEYAPPFPSLLILACIEMLGANSGAKQLLARVAARRAVSWWTTRAGSDRSLWPARAWSKSSITTIRGKKPPV
jgi:hypothetical protein